MAGKQLGKLRQWAGEVISIREKTNPSEEFVQLERDVELRRHGLETLCHASDDFRAYMSGKRHFDTVNTDEKLMHSEALGAVMIGHGEELGSDNEFGRALVTFGRARCQIATIQEAFAVTLTDTFVAYLQQCMGDLDEYAAQRKKLESRRLTYDAALSKCEKAKKEKERREAEEEVEKAKARYEETLEDVNARMNAIRDKERMNVVRLTEFLNLEMNFVNQYLEVLNQAKSEWNDEFLSQTSSPLPPIPPPLNRNASTAGTFSKDSDANTKTSFVSRFSFRSSKSSAPRQESSDSLDADSVDQIHISTTSEAARPTAAPRRETEPTSPRTHSRTQSSSKLSRTRSDSQTTTASRVSKSDKQEPDSLRGKKGSVSGWVGDAMAGMMSRSKAQKVQDKETFAALADSEDEDAVEQKGTPWRRPRSVLSNHSAKSSKSHIDSLHENVRSGSPPSSMKGRGKTKVVKALYDFSGSVDELSFKAGMEIVVLNEVLDDWWMGETNDGKKGLFPSNYTVPVGSTSPVASGAKNTTPRKRRNSSTSGNVLGLAQLSRPNSSISSEDEESRRTLVEDSHISHGDYHNGALSDDDSASFDEFGHGRIVAVRGELDNVGGPRKDVFGDQHDSSDDLLLTRKTEDSTPDQEKVSALANLARATLLVDVNHPPFVVKESPISSTTRSPTKRSAPPPPPRRRSNTAGTTATPPPLPARNLPPSTHRSRSTTSVPQTAYLLPAHAGKVPMFGRSKSETNSPFESQSELDLATASIPIAKRQSSGGDPFGGSPLEVYDASVKL